MKKIYLVALILLYAELSSAQGSAIFLGNPYSGFGKMPLSNALTVTLPADVTWASNLPDTQEEVSWKVVNGTVGDALKQMARGKFAYFALNQNKLLINSVNDTSEGERSQEAVSALISPKLATSEAVAVAKVPIQTQQLSPPKPIKDVDTSPVLQTPIAPFVPTSPKTSAYIIRSEDETLSLALRRWIGSAGYQLVWEAGKDFAARETTYNSLDLLSAIEAVMNDTAHSNYPLHACVYDNKVIRILQVAQGCGRSISEDSK